MRVEEVLGAIKRDPRLIEAAWIRRSFARLLTRGVPGFRPQRVHEVVAERLEAFSQAVAEKRSPRLALFMPPRHGKSSAASICLPVWHLARNPTHEILVTGHSLSLVQRFSRRARALAGSDFVQLAFDLQLAADRQAATEWETLAGGGYRCAGIGGGITGHGAHVLIVDDPVKDAAQAQSALWRDNAMEWFEQVAMTRLAPGGGVLLIQTRWHEDDLAGRVLARGGAEWEVCRYPALAEADDPLGRAVGEALDRERWPAEALARIREQLGAPAFEALYQQRPTAPEGHVWRREWFKRFTEPPARFDEVFQSWDLTFGSTSGTGSWVVGQVWGRVGSRAYLLDEVRFRGDFPEQIRAIVALSQKWPKATAKLIEEKANGAAAIATLRGHVGGLIPVRPQGGKDVRAALVSPLIEGGDVWVPADTAAPWARDFLDECAMFPRGPADDRVDATSQALERVKDVHQSRMPLMIGRL